MPINACLDGSVNIAQLIAFFNLSRKTDGTYYGCPDLAVAEDELTGVIPEGFKSIRPTQGYSSGTNVPQN